MRFDTTSHHSWWVIGITLVAALLLSVLPLPQGLAWFRPEFVALLIIYWVMVLPHQVGIGFAFTAGLLQDLAEMAVPGQHALALVAVAYVCTLTYQRIRNFALWQQSLWVFVLVGLHQLFWNWVRSFTGISANSLIFLLPALASALAWPVVALILEWVRLITITPQRYNS